MARILVVEDERALREGLVDLLSAAGHDVAGAADGDEGLRLALADPHDLIVLDLMLPRRDGYDVCRRVREARPHQAILMLTARGSEADTVAGFSAGADDYLTKPFRVAELLARVEALLRRAASAPSPPEVLHVDGCVIDLGRHTAERDGDPVSLTPREVGILRWLARHRQRAVPRTELLERVWGARGDLQTRTVDMAVVKLRQKIEVDPANPRIVVTVTGVGYAWGPG